MFQHYIAVDWAQSNMAIARMSPKSEKIDVVEGPSDIGILKHYLDELHNQIILTVEESTCSQWLYTELKDHVNDLLVCDPYRNHLLREGPKTDRIDAKKLVRLLRANLLKPVYHSGEAFIYLRRLVRGYTALVASGTRLKNQKAALYLTNGKSPKKDELNRASDRFVAEGIDRRLEIYEDEKERYEAEFKRLSSKHVMIRRLKSLPGIADIGAVKIAAFVVDPKRFPTRNHFLSYCGLVKHDRISGGRSYGKKNTRCCRELKAVFKVAARATVGTRNNNPMRDYYVYLTEEKQLPDYHAAHKVSRRIATLALGILKSQKRFDPRRRNKCNKIV